MVNRINLILRAKNITARQFAEEIGIQPSGMSHILSGRNNPSLEFVTKVIRRYPEIDANWLLLGKGEMFAGRAETGERCPEYGERMVENGAQLDLISDMNQVDNYDVMPVEEPMVDEAPAGRRVVKMVFVYDDHTFSEFSPAK